MNSHAREQHQNPTFEITDPTRLVSLGPNQQNEFFADPGLASPPIEIDNHPTATHESADVMEQVSLSDMIEAQNKK